MGPYFQRGMSLTNDFEEERYEGVPFITAVCSSSSAQEVAVAGPVRQALLKRYLLGQHHDRVHLHHRAFRQSSDADGGACRVRFFEVLRHDFIHDGEMREVGEEDV